MHEIDDKTIAYIRPILPDAVVLDAGAGTGTLDFELVATGVSQVYAIERNRAMLGVIHEKKRFRQIENLTVIDRDFYDPTLFQEIAQTTNYNVVLFRRCLYKKEEEVQKAIAAAYEHLSCGGYVYIVHPEKDLKTYCQDENGGYSSLHFLRRLVAYVGKFLSLVEYEWYTDAEMRGIIKESCPNSQITRFSLSRPAYNCYQIIKP